MSIVDHCGYEQPESFTSLCGWWLYTFLHMHCNEYTQLSTNQLADTVEELFENDYSIEQQYHTLLNGELNLQL